MRGARGARSLRGMRTSVLIAGAGPAAVETVLALRDLAGDRVAVTMLARDPELVYRPLSVVEPFAPGSVRRYSLDELARDVAAERVEDSLASVDARARSATTDA